MTPSPLPFPIPPDSPFFRTTDGVAWFRFGGSGCVSMALKHMNDAQLAVAAAVAMAEWSVKIASTQTREPCHARYQVNHESARLAFAAGLAFAAARERMKGDPKQ